MDDDPGNSVWALPVTRRRGDRRRQAIITATQELLVEVPFSELSVSMISERAEVARSGFYFYFESKYSVLAQILADAAQQLEQLTEHFAGRQPQETAEQFARRMVSGAASVYSHTAPVMRACNAARHHDAELELIVEKLFQGVYRAVLDLVQVEVQAGTARPISNDLSMLVRSLLATSALTLTGDPFMVGEEQDAERGQRLLVDLWVNSVWGRDAAES